MKNKKAKFQGKKATTLSIEEIIGLLIAAAAIIILVWYLVSILFPFDKDAETAKSYMNTLTEQIAVADNGGVGEFSIWQKDVSGPQYFLVYFGSQKVFTFPANDGRELIFKFTTLAKNVICICYPASNTGSGTNCPSCTSLNYPVFLTTAYSKIALDKDVAWTWDNSAGSLDIKKQDNKYLFLPPA